MGPAAVTSSVRRGGGGLLAAAGLVAGVTLLARAVGLVRWVVFSHAVGATCVGQVYGTANLVPNVLFEVAAGGALAAVAVPLVAGHLHRGRDDLAGRTASALLTWTVTVLLPLAVVVALAAGPLTGWLLGGVEGCSPAEARAAGELMLLLFAPQVLLYGVGIVLTGVLHAHGRFLAAATAPVVSSLVVITVYLAFGALHDPTAPLEALPPSALWLLAGGTTLGVVALVLPVLGPATRLDLRWRPTWRFPEGTGTRAGLLVLAGVAVVLAQQTTTVVVLLLSNAATGVAAINVWTYAQTAYLLPYAVLVVPLATVSFPRLSAGRGRGQAVLHQTLAGVVAAAVLAAAVLVALRRELGRAFVLLDAGADGPGAQSLAALPPTLGLLAPGLPGFAVLAVATRALYAHGSPLRAAAAAGAGWAVAGLVPLVLAPADATVGTTLRLLAVGSSVGMTVAGLLLLRELRLAWGAGAGRRAARSGLGVLVGAVPVVLLAETVLGEPAGGWVPTLGRALLVGLAVLVSAVVGLGVADPGTVAHVRRRGRTRRSPDPGPGGDAGAGVPAGEGER
ncbi:murein biosynthesis integral membrane protein MurJ [uncultured Ornithinimicrobium sp.]|uniref:murein biosynthesis integral membrane protein MurJ n=1 Tax=uncultured Ornithinimicrobium sp. TaxID=259307 RepID=UPI002596DAFE|nr:lipid II flippase MurJ [uncultured Ornithinimicrobium sp.]